LLADTHPELEDWARSQRNVQGVSQRSPAAGTAPASAPHSERPAESSTIAPSLLFTAKERDVIRLLANNLSNKEIASALDLSVQTVKWHLKNLFGKLNAGSRKHLVDRARMMGIISE